jgi:hypothetical protein
MSTASPTAAHRVIDAALARVGWRFFSDARFRAAVRAEFLRCGDCCSSKRS